MLDTNLTDFVRVAKTNGVPDSSLVAILRQQGWQERALYQALGDYYAGALGMPVPSRGSRAESPRDAFLYLLLFITLGTWIFALIQLADRVIDLVYRVNPPLYGYGDFRDSVSGYLAAIIVAFPLQLWVAALIGREARRRPESLESGVRKWLTYVALVVTAVVLLGDATWFVADLLRGELTLPFVLKTAVLVVLAGGVFAYYLGGIRRDEVSATRDWIFAGGAALCVAAGLVAGFVPLGSPAYERMLNHDVTRVSDLQSMATAIHNSYGSASLPATLDAQIQRKDPTTQKPYAYERIDAHDYRLCAIFEAGDALRSDQAWEHGAGRKCFVLDAREEPPYAPPSLP